MKFNVVVGNPPYNKDAYIDFAELGNRVSLQCSSMIIPAKWQGKTDSKNSRFRDKLSKYMEKVVYYPDCGDIFYIADVGGICYYIMNKDIHSDCLIVNKCNTNKYIDNKQSIRSINDGLSCYSDSIVSKVGKTDNICKEAEIKQFNYMITTPPAIGGTKGCESFLFGKTGMLQCLKAGTVYTRDKAVKLPSHYKVLCSSDNLDELNSMISFVNTKLVRFLVLIGLCTQSTITPETWRYVPRPDKKEFNHIFTDEEMYNRYGLDDSDIEIIENTIKERK